MNGIVKGRVFAAVVCASFLALCQSASATVISSQVYNTNGHTYLLLAPSSWPDAEAEALTLNGHLVTVNDAAENAFVYSTFGPTAISNSPATGKVNLWLGYNDVASEGNFVWVSGQSSSYTDWFSGQPQDTFGDEDYTGIRVRGSTGSIPVGHWIDIVSDGRLGDLNYGVVEVEGLGPSAPEPSALLLATLGASIGVGGRFLHRRGRAGRAAIS